MPSKPCIECKKYKPIFTDGRCRRCFVSWGTQTGIDPSLFPAKCAAKDCTDYSEKLGYCDRHYRRVKDHGHENKVRVVSQERQHPEYHNWHHLKSRGFLCNEWLDFWRFLADVGTRPSEKHRLTRPSLAEVYSPSNYQWFASKLGKTPSFYTDEQQKENVRKRNARREKGHWIGSGLRRFFGITREQYDALLEKQGGGCAFCGVDASIDPDGKRHMLSVDHCHTTGEIRGLLCRNHNTMIGMAQDDPEILLKAAMYVERTSYTGLFVPEAGIEINKKPRGVANVTTGNICSVPDCGHRVGSKGMCNMHYARFKRTGDTSLKHRTLASCSEPGCTQTMKARGFCMTHYNRHSKAGNLPPKNLICTG
jgi:hypothetical protein